MDEQQLEAMRQEVAKAREAVELGKYEYNHRDIEYPELQARAKHLAHLIERYMVAKYPKRRHKRVPWFHFIR